MTKNKKARQARLEERSAGFSIRKLSSLLLLVLFVFIIQFVSVAIAGLLSFSVMRAGILPPMQEQKFPALLVFLLLVSLFLGTVLAVVGGDRLLRPIRSLSEATREVASGNFSVRVETNGPREVARLAANFNDMAAELSSIETLRNDFVNNISHEYKTPLVSIRGFARRLKKDTLTKEKRDEYIDIIISETERLTQLSSNVLLLSKLESSEKLTDQISYSLDEQIRRSILLMEPQLEKKQLEVDARLQPVKITGNDEMLQHVWINLLGNAIKFSPVGGTITVSLQYDGTNTIVSIKDDGPGLDHNAMEHLFDKFFQADCSRSTEGNGLGLSLVKRILDLSDGHITVESAPGKGACFAVVL